MGIRRPDHQRWADPLRARAVRGRNLGSARGGRAHRTGWAQMAEGVTDTTFWGALQGGVAALERELTRLRRAQSAHARELGRPIARASVLNLVVYADREEHARRAARSIADLALRHPCARSSCSRPRRARRRGQADRHALPLPTPTARDSLLRKILVRAHGDVDDRLGRR